MVVAELFAKLGLQVDKKSWSAGNDVIAGMGKALSLWFGFKVVQSIGGMIQQVADLGGRLDDLRMQLGVGSEALQELGYAAVQNGGNLEAVTSALGKYAKGLADVAKTGKGPTADALRALGISMRSLRDIPLDKQLEVIADRISKMPDGPRKAAIAMDLFGKSGRELIPLLNSGSAGIAELRDEARKLGVVMSDESVKGLADFGDDVDRLKLSWQGIKQTVVVALLPTLRDMVQRLRDWIIANREVIASKVESFVRGLAAAARVFAGAIAFAVEHWREFVALIAGVTVVTSMIRIIKLVQWLQQATTIAAMKTLAAWTVAALPFVALTAVIAGIVLAFTKYRDRTMKVLREIKRAASAVWEEVKRGFRAAFEFIGNLPIVKQLLWLANKLSLFDRTPIRNAHELRTPLGTSIDPEGERAWKEWTKDAPKDEHGQPLAFAPTRPSVRTAPNITNTFGDINVTTPSSDPVAVAQEVRKVVRDEWQREMRDAYAGTGVA